ncbi:hypothetical protein [Novosphingobium sp.]|uniref:hypothetical protein n=1 Tax=Novosphingobium sp. TaxID=1874826 RepID=UPI003B52710D
MKTNSIMGLGCAYALGLAAMSAHAQQMADPAMPASPARAGDHAHGGGGRGFDAMDANHDGFVTLDEWKAAGRREDRFAQFDANHDGRITREEMKAFRDKMRAEHPRGGPGGPGDGGNVGDGAMQPQPQ